MSRSSRSTRTYLHLAAAMPMQIDSKRPDNVRMVLKRAAQGLLDAGVPILRSFAFERAQDGRWLIVFHRAKRPRQAVGPRHAAWHGEPGDDLHVGLVAFDAAPRRRAMTFDRRPEIGDAARDGPQIGLVFHVPRQTEADLTEPCVPDKRLAQ
jgi:hypothetical protein